MNIRSNTSGTKRKITATDAYLMSGGKYTATDIAFESTYSSSSYVGRSHSSNGGFFGTFADCSFSSAVNNFYNVVSLAYPSQVRAYRTEFANFTDRVFNNMQICYIDSCLFRNNGNYCLGNSSNGAYSFDVSNSIFDNNVGFVYNFSGLSARITNNIINNTTTNLFGSGYGGDFEFFVNNIFSNNAGSISANVASGTSRMYANAYYNNTNIDASFSGNYNPITLTADPFVSSSSGDWNLNSDSGGGATLRANNFSMNTDTAVYPFRQYVSDDFDSGAGGGSIFHPLAQ